MDLSGRAALRGISLAWDFKISYGSSLHFLQLHWADGRSFTVACNKSGGSRVSLDLSKGVSDDVGYYGFLVDRNVESMIRGIRFFDRLGDPLGTVSHEAAPAHLTGRDIGQATEWVDVSITPGL